MRNARHRITVLADNVGTRHPEYAGGLNQLALLLIMQGEPEAAEPLLREALEIRRESLGESHPDFATNLSSLGGLLWARGALDEAEPLLRRAAEVRVATLGQAHPKTVVSLNSLEQLRQARRTWAETAVAGKPTMTTTRESTPPSAPVAPTQALPPSVATPSAPSPTRSSGARPLEEIGRSVEWLRTEFVRLGDRLTAAAEAFRTGGPPPEESLIGAVAEARTRFEATRAQVREVSTALDVPPERELRDLASLAATMPRLLEADAARRRFEAERDRALAILDRVGRLVCGSDPRFAPLEVARQAAQGLRRTLETAGPRTTPAEVGGLLDGSHSYNALLALVAADEATSDAHWADWYDRVETAFGPTLAVAVARGRIAGDASPAGATS